MSDTAPDATGASPTGTAPTGTAPTGTAPTGTAPDGTDDPEVAAAVAAELRLLQPGVRASAALAGALLHPDFREFGASGTVYDRAAILALLAAEEHAPGARPAAVSRMHGVRLAPGLVHLTYDSDSNGRRAHRSSLWRRTGDGWQVWFHHGTLIPDESEKRPAEPDVPGAPGQARVAHRT